MIDSNYQSNHEPLINTISHDAHEHAHNLTDWQQHYDQISAGEFYGQVIERPFDDLQIFKEHTSRALSQSCLVWPDSIWLGIPPQAQANNSHSKINGLALNSNNIMCRPGNIEFELTTPDAFDIYGVVISRSKLMLQANKQGIELNWQDILHNERLSIPESTLNAINYLLARLLNSQVSNHKATPDHLTQDLILMGLLEVLSKESPNQTIYTSYQHRKDIVNNARTFLQQHHDRAITLSELCEACHTSRRTLQNSFESILGLSPIQYLRYTRLNGVRRDLKQGKATETVGDIASRWGFWHLGQFAKDYKNVFGELPSETLK
jgi:AraC family ethanolamine operon transcriptional activator